MVRHPETGKYRRTRLFVIALGYNWEAVCLLSFKSSSRIWAQLHETASRRLGGTCRVNVFDNLKEGVRVLSAGVHSASLPAQFLPRQVAA